MLKRVAIFTGISVIAAVIFLARFDKTTVQLEKRYDAKCMEMSQPSEDTGSLTCTIRSGQNATPPWWHTLIAWPEGITAWLITLTLYAIVWQAWETRKAAEATRDSVQAQERAMALNVNTERPYLVISAECPSPDRFVFAVKNEGRTPAKIESIWCKALMANHDGTLQIPSDEDTQKPFLGVTPLLLPQNGTHSFYLCDEHRVQLMRGDTFSAIYFYGRIRYSDVLKNRAGGPYETRWMYCQLPLKGKRAIPSPDPRRPEHNTWT